MYKKGDLVTWMESQVGMKIGIVTEIQHADEHEQIYTAEASNGLYTVYSSWIEASYPRDEIFSLVLGEMAKRIHQNNIEAGWWNDPETGQSLKEGPIAKYALFTKLFLVHSELSEAGEGIRKNLKDDHLPHRDMGEVEFADVLIRLLDCAAAKGYDIGVATTEKMAYNAVRADHKPENRNKEGGKSV